MTIIEEVHQTKAEDNNARGGNIMKAVKSVVTGLAVLGFVLFLTLTITPVFGGTVNYTYDDAGRLTKVEYENGMTIEYTYDNAGNLLQRVVSQEGYILTVTKSGTGTGTVTSSPAGISCGEDCGETYTKVQKVKLTAKADSTSTFTGWSGGGCSGTKTCTVTVNAPVTVTAGFALKTPDISVAQTSVEFKDTKVGKKGTKTLKITNNGTGELNIVLSILENTVDFGIQGNTTVIIKPKKSYTVKVLFTPKSAGAKTATLRIASNDSDTPTIDISLSGAGQ